MLPLLDEAEPPVPCDRPRRVLDVENRHDLLVHGPTLTGRTLRACAHACRSQIEHDIVVWLGAADERASVGGEFDGVGAVSDIASDERGLAGVADAGAARPADGYVACFGEFEQAGVVAAPWDGE